MDSTDATQPQQHITHSSGYVGSDGETDGFVSGEEDFDPVLDRAFVRDNVVHEPIKGPEEDDNHVKFVSSSEFFLRPIAKISVDDDDDDDDDDGEEDKVEEADEVFSFVDGGKVSFVDALLGGGGLGPVVEPETGLEVVEPKEGDESEVVSGSKENGGVVEGSVVSGGDGEKENGVEFSSGSDSVAEAAVHVDLLQTRAAVVGDAETIEESAIKGLEVPAGVSLDNVFEQVSHDIEEPNDSKSVAVDAEADGVVVAEPAVDKLVEEHGDDFTNEDDSVVQAVHVNLSQTGAAVVGDVEKIEESEIKGMAVLDGVGVENAFDRISCDVELPNDSGSVAVKSESDSGVVADPGNYKLVEESGVDSSEGDSVVQAIHVNLSQTGAAVVGDVEKIEESEIKGMEAPLGVSLENGFDQISKVEVQSESDKAVLTESGSVEPKTVVAGVDEIDFQNKKEIEFELQSDSATGQEGPTTENDADEVKAVSETQSLNHHVSDLPHHEPAHEGRSDNADISVDEQANATEVVEQSSTNQEIRLEEEEKKHSQGEDDTGSSEPISVSHREINVEDEEEKELDDDENDIQDDEDENDGMIFGSSAAAKQFLEELERGSGTGSNSGAESYGERSLSYRDDSQRVDGQIVTDSDEEVDTDEEEGGGKELFDSAALAALLKAATGGGASDGGSVTFTSPDGSRLFSVERPAGLGSSMLPLKPGSRPTPSNLLSNPTVGGDSETSLSEEEKKKLEKVQQLRVKLLRLVHRLGVSAEDSLVKQVLYRLAVISGRQISEEFSVDAAKATALELEAEDKDSFDFSLNILVLGKTGVGKSATINSIFGEEKTPIHAFGPATTSVKEIVGVVDGIKIKVFDTPGLKSAAMEQSVNRRMLSSVQKLTKKCPPDIVFYVDRLDTQSRDLNDVPVLRSITSAFGPSIWRSTIVTLTHAASAPPDGPSGSPLNYELFVAQRSQILQQTIGQSVGEMRFTNPTAMSPITLVENHPSCRRNREGQAVLPNGQSWRPQLLLLSSSMKILAEATSLSKPAEPFDHRKLFGFRTRSAPLPYLLSWLLQSRTHPKLSSDQGGENADSDVELADLADSDEEEEEDEYDQLPSFKPLKKAQMAKLTKEQKKAYLDEYDYRVKLLQKKMWREELRRMKEMKKGNKASADDYGYQGEENPEDAGPAAVPVTLPDMVLPPSFDSENPAYRYRFLEPTSQFLARPVLDAQGWDHDCGYDGVNLEYSQAIVDSFPAAVAVQLTKDKKEFNIHLDSSVAAKHGENGSTMAGFDIQNVGKQLAYIVRGETKWKNLKKNKTTAGVSVTFLGENVSTGVKIEDQFPLGKRLVLVATAGTVRSQGDAAYGSNLEVRLREADFPIGQDNSTLGLSLVKWRGDLALGANVQSQITLGRDFKIAVRAGLNNKRQGQISIRTSSSEHLQLALVAVIPILRAAYNLIFPGVSLSENNYQLY